jgi:hypothetical protein
MEWLKRNATLAVGIGLPLLLMLFFAAASWLPKMFVAPPAYDVLFLTNYHDYGGNGLKAEVRDGRTHFIFTGENYGYGWPKLYRYSPASNKLNEIPLTAPESLPKVSSPPVPVQSHRITEIAVPELADVKVDNASTAPDGYMFRSEHPSSPGLVGSILFSSRYAFNVALYKDGRSQRIPNPDNNNYYYNPKFIGWVIP